MALALTGCVLDSSDSAPAAASSAAEPAATPTPTPVVTTYTVGGSVSGLTSGTLVLKNNGTDALTVTANGAFKFANGLTLNGSYNVTVGTQPAGLICTISGGSGTHVVTDITNVSVVCGQTLQLAPSTTFPALGSVVVASDGTVYTCKAFDSTIYRIPPGAATATIIAAGSGITSCASMNLDASDNLYIADDRSRVIWKIAAGANTATALPLTSPTFTAPTGVAVDAAGTVYVADPTPRNIYKFAAGSSTGTILNASLVAPSFLSVDASGNLYVSSGTALGIFQIPAGSSIGTLVPGSIGLQTWQTAVDAQGNLFAAGFSDHVLYKFAAGASSASIVQTGSLSLGFVEGIAVDASGNVYFAGESPNQLYEVAAP
ncbi:hypothetical protein GCM10010971_28830 [Silvimonas amylolytica]|uniref:NHL repeat containing protein n=2 Tax=Silvimonas amylolytica TaxID=449663 RepID=A0ABQ2PN77_9NEIS|nr:hypothetical protein GCM10010971_28830 [Silvimonas amylolytica]